MFSRADKYTDKQNKIELTKENDNVKPDKDNSPILHLVSKKIPMTNEMRKRKYVEELRKKYSVKRENTGYIL